MLHQHDTFRLTMRQPGMLELSVCLKGPTTSEALAAVFLGSMNGQPRFKERWCLTWPGFLPQTKPKDSVRCPSLLPLENQLTTLHTNDRV